MLKCLRKILEIRGSAGLYVTTKGTTSLAENKWDNKKYQLSVVILDL